MHLSKSIIFAHSSNELCCVWRNWIGDQHAIILKENTLPIRASERLSRRERQRQSAIERQRWLQQKCKIDGKKVCRHFQVCISFIFPGRCHRRYRYSCACPPSWIRCKQFQVKNSWNRTSNILNVCHFVMSHLSHAFRLHDAIKSVFCYRTMRFHQFVLVCVCLCCVVLLSELKIAAVTEREKNRNTCLFARELCFNNTHSWHMIMVTRFAE